MIVKQDSFITPYPQPELGGKLGLTTHDLAKVLGKKAFHINRDMRSAKVGKLIYDRGLELIQIRICSKYATKSFSNWVLSVPAVKAYLAMSRTPLGMDYLIWLLFCERITDEEYPKVLEENKTLKAENEELRADSEKTKKLISALEEKLDARDSEPEKKPKAPQKFITIKRKAYIQHGIFGGTHIEYIEEKVPIDTINKKQLRLYQAIHQMKRGDGLKKSADKKISDILREVLATDGLSSLDSKVLTEIEQLCKVDEEGQNIQNNIQISNDAIIH